MSTINRHFHLKRIRPINWQPNGKRIIIFFNSRERDFSNAKRRVGQYGWLVLAVFVVSSWFLYSDAVRATTVSKQISAIQTFAVAESKEAVLSLTLSDGSNVKYVVKASEPYTAQLPKQAEHSAEILQDWQLASAGTAVNVGDAKVPLGIALRISH